MLHHAFINVILLVLVQRFNFCGKVLQLDTDNMW